LRTTAAAMVYANFGEELLGYLPLIGVGVWDAIQYAASILLG
jgi:hypothetical protein